MEKLLVRPLVDYLLFLPDNGPSKNGYLITHTFFGVRFLFYAISEKQKNVKGHYYI